MTSSGFKSAIAMFTGAALPAGSISRTMPFPSGPPWKDLIENIGNLRGLELFAVFGRSARRGQEDGLKWREDAPAPHCHFLHPDYS